MRYEQPEMEILVFEGSIATDLTVSEVQLPGDNSGTGGSGLEEGGGNWVSP